jgi:formylglycine-generating enzyme required for sulfatase activity
MSTAIRKVYQGVQITLTIFLSAIFLFSTQALAINPENPTNSFISPSTGMEFVHLPAGCSQMGSNNGFHFEQPVHEVCVDAFFIGRYEVTQKQWVEIMGDNSSKFIGENRPVDRVSWLDAQAFIDKLNLAEATTLYRLPREAEWEYAARAGTTTEYYWGDKMDDDYLWYYGTSNFQTHDVGTKKANAFGLYDMLGNVWEWTGDWFGADYYQHSPRNNPQGPKSGKFRVRRGGSSANLISHVRSATRYRGKVEKRHHILGIRVVRSLSKDD